MPGCRRARTCSTASGRCCCSATSAPSCALVYHRARTGRSASFVRFINRAKDELVTPDDFDRLRRRGATRPSRRDTGASTTASSGSRPRATSSRCARSAARYAGVRASERAEARGETPRLRRRARRRRPPTARPAGRSPATGSAAVPRPVRRRRPRRGSTRSPTTYVVDGAALEVLRLTELARVYRAYEAELARRGALDFGEQIAAVTQLFKTRPNVLRRWQRQFRYILVDEFQDANVAQIELIELLGRTPDRPDNVMVVGDDDQSIYRFRGASFAAFAEFDVRPRSWMARSGRRWRPGTGRPGCSGTGAASGAGRWAWSGTASGDEGDLLAEVEGAAPGELGFVRVVDRRELAQPDDLERRGVAHVVVGQLVDAREVLGGEPTAALRARRRRRPCAEPRDRRPSSTPRRRSRRLARASARSWRGGPRRPPRTLRERPRMPWDSSRGIGRRSCRIEPRTRLLLGDEPVVVLRRDQSSFARLMNWTNPERTNRGEW